ncbi:MAG: response regulator [Desulfobacterales bacterium]|nr:response regulator [Desulfobacterales bacterium]MBF0396802.1 response regulator [Desulfobacterales bacterium]
MKTLIADDDFMNRTLLKEILESYGRCDVAVNGKEALEAFKMAWDEGKPYDLICMDIMMPKMDGQKAVKEIRKFEEEKGTARYGGTKIIMTTALGDPQNIVNAFRSSIDAYLIKPFDIEKFIGELRALKLI